MTSVTFENATIRDVISKAAKIAPTKGAAFDKAHGIVIEVNADSNVVVVRATNIEVYYMEIADFIDIKGGSKKWRLPSKYLDGICSKLPITSGSSVVFDDSDSNQIKIQAGRMRATLRLMDTTYYPEWDAFDVINLSPVPDLGARLQQVHWAASRVGEPPLTGIHLNGEIACATDNYKIALTPCKIEHLSQPVTVPYTIYASLTRHLGEVDLGVEGGSLLIMPDKSTQIKTVIFGQKYPPIERALKRIEPNSLVVNKNSLIEMVERALVMGQQDRSPLLKMIIGNGELAVMMEDREVGLLGDVIDIPGYADHSYHYIGFTPDHLSPALEAAPNDLITIHYTDQQAMKPVRLDGGSGYEVLIMPRNLERSADE